MKLTENTLRLVIREGIMDWMKNLGNKPEPKEDKHQQWMEKNSTEYLILDIFGIPLGGPSPHQQDFQTEQKWIDYATSHDMPISEEKASKVWSWFSERLEEFQSERDGGDYQRDRAMAKKLADYAYLDEEWEENGSKGKRPSEKAASKYWDRRRDSRNSMRRSRGNTKSIY